MWREVFSVAPVALILAISCITNAQEPVRQEIPHLVEYKSSPDLPNGIAFHMILLTLDRFHADSGGVDSASWVAHELELSDSDSHNFVSNALTTLYLIETDIETQLTSHACRYASDGVSKEDKFAALQQTYAISKAIYDHHFDQFKAALDSDTGERFQMWIDEKKLSTFHHEIDFETAYKRTDKDPTETLALLCWGAN